MITTLLADLNAVDGDHVSVFLETAAYLEGSPASGPHVGEAVYLHAEGGIRCWALVDQVEGSVATLKLDMNTWAEEIEPHYESFFTPTPQSNYGAWMRQALATT